jgi:hypothetical protein
VAEEFITGVIDWTTATLRLRQPASGSCSNKSYD